MIHIVLISLNGPNGDAEYYTSLTKCFCRYVKSTLVTFFEPFWILFRSTLSFVKSSLNAFAKLWNLLQKHNMFVQDLDFQPASNFVHLVVEYKGTPWLLCIYNPYRVRLSHFDGINPDKDICVLKIFDAPFKVFWYLMRVMLML